MRRPLVVCLSLVLFSATALCAEADPFALYREGRFAEAARGFMEKDMAEPKEIRWRYNRGVAEKRAENPDAAEAALESAWARSRDPETRFRSAYNLGNVSFEKEDFQRAADFYARALAIRPEDEDARRNLELALWKAKQAKEQQSEEQRGKQCPDGQKGQGESGENQDQQGQGGDQGASGQGQDQGEEGRDQGEQKPSGDQTPAGENRKPQNLDGELEPMNSRPLENGADPSRAREEQARMERNKAEALLDNVEENPALLFQRMQGAERTPPGSGKNW